MLEAKKILSPHNQKLKQTKGLMPNIAKQCLGRAFLTLTSFHKHFLTLPNTVKGLGLQMTSLTDKNKVFVNPKEMLEMSEGLFAQYSICQSGCWV